MCLKAEKDNWIEEPNVLVLVEDFVSMIQNCKQVRSLQVAVELASYKIDDGFLGGKRPNAEKLQRSVVTVPEGGSQTVNV